MAKMTKACKGTSYPKSSNVSKRLGSPSKAKKGVTMKKAKSGTSLGMKSVKAGYDKNPSVTRADIIVAAKKEAKSGTKMKKALLGIGIGKEERMARRAERQGNRQMRRSERQSMRMSRDNANPYRRGCKGGNCASRNIGTRIVGFKKGGVKKAQDGDTRPIGNKPGNRSSYSELEPGKKFNYIEGPDRSFGVGRRKQMPSGNSKVKTIQYDMGFVPSNSRITKQKLDSEGNIIKSKERSISVKRAARMMRRKGGDYKTGGKVSKAKTGAKMTKKCAYGCK